MPANNPCALLLLLLDSRSPAGAHNHSAGMEAAIGVGMVRGVDDVEAFCRGRLRTSGAVAAAFAAAACRLAAPVLPAPPVSRDLDTPGGPWQASDINVNNSAPQPGDLDTPGASWPTSDINVNSGGDAWAALDAEFEARTPSEAMRAASRQLARGLLRLVRATLPGWEPPWTATPHHPILLGAAVAAAGGTPELAARAAALGSISVPASAGVRLLGLDPFAIHTMLARLAVEIDDLPVPADLPAGGAPALDLLADFHLTTEVRLFAS